MSEVPVSVIIPAFNRAGTIARAIGSAQQQHPHRPAEIIVVDDGSSDETSERAAACGARVVRHPRNLGVSAARNSGLAAARYPWIALLDSDDEWLPHHLATIWPLCNGHVVAAGSQLRCGPDPARDRFHGPPTRRPLVLRTPAPLVFPANFVPTSGTLASTEHVRRVGGWNAHLDMAEDLDLLLRLLRVGTGAFSPRVTVIYHMHEGQMSRMDAERRIRERHAEVAASATGDRWWSPLLLEAWRGAVAWDGVVSALKAHRRQEALPWVAGIARHPLRLAGVGGTWIWRWLIRRRSAQVDRQGGFRGRAAGR